MLVCIAWLTRWATATDVKSPVGGRLAVNTAPSALR